MIKQILYIIVFQFISLNLFTQEKIGVITDNYLPVNQTGINPSAMVDQKPWISINVAGAHAFARTNFFYIRNSRLGFFKEAPDYRFDAPAKNGRAFATAQALGPSVTMNWRDHAFGFHMGVKTYASMSRIPAVLGEIVADEGVENIEDGTYFMRNGRLKAMSWGEVGLSYGRIAYKRDRIMIYAAGTVNRLIGIQQSSLIIKDAQVDVVNGNGTLRNIDGKYSYTEPNWGSGKGWGLNAGITYKKLLLKDNANEYTPHSRRGGCRNFDYLYKVGVSLIDLGYINFSQESMTAMLNDTASLEDIENAEGSVLGVEKNSFNAILPTALSVQVDYRVQERIYVNALLVQKVSIPRSFGVERSNVLAVSPRYESSWISASMPLSLSNYSVPQLGLYLRFGPLAVGTDHLSSFIIKKNIRAADLYVYLNIPIKKSPECRDKGAREMGKWECPVW